MAARRLPLRGKRRRFPHRCPMPQAAVGVLDLTPREPIVVHSGSVSLRGCLPDGEEWAEAPSWRPPAHSSGGESNEGEPAPRNLPLAQILALLLQPPLRLWVSAGGPLRWPCELLDFQKTGVSVLIDRSSVLLADDMGLGKTVQAAAAMRLLVLRGEVQRILVVAPAAVLRNWRDELNLWAPELRVVEATGTASQRVWKWDARVHVKIVSYETLRSDIRRVMHRHGQWDLVCLDEAQRIKNSGSAISGSMRAIASRRRWALTGTPLENSLDDVRSILAFLHAAGEDHGDIRQALGRVQLRRRKPDVLADLPPKRITELFVPLSRPQREEYGLLLGRGVNELRLKGPEATVTDVLALIVRLKQVCNFSSAGGRSSKLDDLALRLATLRQEGHKALVFSQFTDGSYGVRRIAAALQAFGPVVYTGDMTPERRRQAISVFRADPDAGAMVLSLRAGGVGLNLQSASYVFHFDRWWNPASEAQAEDRSHRLGQTRGVSVYKYICEDTIEERVHEILRAKRALFAEYVDDVCLDLGQRLSGEELFGLFDLQPPARTSKTDRLNAAEVDIETAVRSHLAEEGYEVEVVYPVGDLATDLVAARTDELGMRSVLLVRCVSQARPAEADVIHGLVSLLTDDETTVRGAVVCPSGFTDDAARLAARHGISTLSSPSESRRWLPFSP